MIRITTTQHVTDTTTAPSGGPGSSGTHHSTVVSMVESVAVRVFQDRGAQGPVGPTGPQGPQGAQGPPGSSHIVDHTAPGVAPETNAVGSQTLVDDGTGSVLWRQLTLDDILPAFNAHLSGGGVVEVGASVVHPSFSCSYDSGPPTAATITDDQGNPPLVLSTPFTSGQMVTTYTKTTNNAVVGFTLSADKGSVNKTAGTSYQWEPRAYWGVSSSDGSGADAAFITGLASSQLQGSRNTTFTVSPGAGEYIYYAYPTAYGAATFSVGGFVGGFQLISSTIAVTNTHGVTQNYTLYRSTNPSLGTTTVDVS